MPLLRTAVRNPIAAGGLVIADAILVAVAAVAVGGSVETYLLAAAAASFVVGAAVLIWNADPAYTMCVALALTSFSGNWPYLHVPGSLSPDRLLFVATIFVVIARAPGCRDRPALSIRPIHLLMATAVVYVVISALFSQSLLNRHDFLAIVDRVGVVPFGIFFIAPVVFTTPQRRRLMALTLAVMGVYYGLTAVFEAAHVNALVWPRYILDPAVGIHFGRARGPFVEAVSFGTAMFLSMCGSAMLFRTATRRTSRAFAATSFLLCGLGIVLTVTRSAWLGGASGLLVLGMLLGIRGRAVLGAAVVLTCVLGVASLTIGGLATDISTRTSDIGTVHDRENLNSAALNMFNSRPLFGFGWAQFIPTAPEYFSLSPKYPLPLYPQPVHNLWLAYLAELGLVGTVPLLGATLLALFTVLRRVDTLEQRLWRASLLAFAADYAIVSNSVTPETFPTVAFFVIAGVAAGAMADPAHVTRPLFQFAPTGVDTARRPATAP